MTSDLDIYRSANVLIREHGGEAAMEIAKHADAMAGATAELKISLPMCVSAFCP